MANLLLAILAYALIPEEYLPEEQMGVCEYAGSMVGIIKAYYRRRASNSVNLLEYMFLENQLFILLFWPAYYFNQLGYGYASSTIVAAFPCCAILGVLVCQPVFERFPTHSGLIGCILAGLSCLSFAGMLLLGKDEGEIPIYIVLIGLGSMFWITLWQRFPPTAIAARG